MYFLIYVFVIIIMKYLHFKDQYHYYKATEWVCGPPILLPITAFPPRLPQASSLRPNHFRATHPKPFRSPYWAEPSTIKWQGATGTMGILHGMIKAEMINLFSVTHFKSFPDDKQHTTSGWTGAVCECVGPFEGICSLCLVEVRFVNTLQI